MNGKSKVFSLFHRVKFIFDKRNWTNMANIRIFDQLLVDLKFTGNSRDFPEKHFVSREAKNIRDPGFPGSRERNPT